MIPKALFVVKLKIELIGIDFVVSVQQEFLRCVDRVVIDGKLLSDAEAQTLWDGLDDILAAIKRFCLTTLTIADVQAKIVETSESGH